MPGSLGDNGKGWNSKISQEFGMPILVRDDGAEAIWEGGTKRQEGDLRDGVRKKEGRNKSQGRWAG